MFGIEMAASSADHLRELEAVLDRQRPIASLDALASAISTKAKVETDLRKIAFGIDANVFLKMVKHSKSADILDYLASRHDAPLILPGQAIQEFWNNQLAAVDTVAVSLRKKFDALSLEANKVDKDFGDFAQKWEALLNDFSSTYGHLYDEATLRSTAKILEILQKKAFLSYVPRTRFHNMAVSRKRTKTPPGFKDDGDGDFFIWVEFLFGLLHTSNEGKAFQHSVMLTNDVKADWSRAGIAHPILTAEVKELVGVSFEVWTIDELSEAIAKQLAGTATPILPVVAV